MKKLKIIIGLILLALVVSGCVPAPKYDNYPPRYPNFKRVVEHKNPNMKFYSVGKETLYIPKGSKWITVADLKWQTEEPKDGDWNNIEKKALILHELNHLFDLSESWKYIIGGWLFPKKEMWRAERESYQVQLYYLKLRGKKFTKKDIERYVNYMTDPVYIGMCTEKEARKFIESIVGKPSE